MDQKLEIAAEDALVLFNNVLPILEQYGALAGPTGATAALAAGAAQVAIPILINLGNDLASKGVITPEEQQATLDRFNAVLAMFGQPQWQPSTPDPTSTPPGSPS